jgi:hypothetical protein
VTRFKEEVLSHYLDKEGMVTIDRDPTYRSAGNPQLNTGIFYAMLALRGELDREDCSRFYNAIAPCAIAPGLYSKYQDLPNFISHDDYIGICTGAFFTDAPFAEDTFEYGYDTDWHFDNRDPEAKELDAWHERFPGRIAFYAMAAHRGMSFFDKLGFNSALQDCVNRRADNTTPQILMWCQTRVAKRRGEFPVGIEAWEESIVRTYGSVNALFAAYFGASHPFATYAVF